MRPSVATIAALVAATIATLSQSPVVSAAPARVADAENAIGHIGNIPNRPPYKFVKREVADESYDGDGELLDDDEDTPVSALDFNALAAADYGYGGSDSSATTGGTTTAADTSAGAPAEAGSAPESWDVALNMNPNDLPLLNNQAATTTSAASAVQVGAPTDVNVDPNATASPTEQVQVGAPTDVNIDGSVTTTGTAVQVGAPTDVNVDGTTTTTTTGTAVVIGAPTDVNVDGTTTTTVYATPTQGAGNNNGGNVDGEFDCLEVLYDSNLQCRDVQSIDESQFNCIEDVDFGKDFMCTDVDGNEFDCEPIDGQTGGSGSDGGSSTDPSYSNSDSADSDAAGLATGAASSWKSGIIKTSVATAFVLVASAAFLL